MYVYLNNFIILINKIYFIYLFVQCFRYRIVLIICFKIEVLICDEIKNIIFGILGYILLVIVFDVNMYF